MLLSNKGNTKDAQQVDYLGTHFSKLVSLSGKSLSEEFQKKN